MSRVDFHEVRGDISPWKAYELKPESEHEGNGIAYVIGDFEAMSQDPEGPLMRLHSACLFGEVFGALDCDCAPQLEAARRRILEAGSGILFYLGQEGRGAGLMAKALGYALMESEGLNTAEAYERLGLPFDQREYGHVVRFLIEHGIMRARVLTNSSRKVAPLEAAGIQCTRVPHLFGITDQNWSYLQTKAGMGHSIPSDRAEAERLSEQYTDL